MTPLQDILWKLYARQYVLCGRDEELEAMIERLDSPDVPPMRMALTDDEFHKWLSNAQEERRRRE